MTMTAAVLHSLDRCLVSYAVTVIAVAGQRRARRSLSVGTMTTLVESSCLRSRLPLCLRLYLSPRLFLQFCSCFYRPSLCLDPRPPSPRRHPPAPHRRTRARTRQTSCRLDRRQSRPLGREPGRRSQAGRWGDGRQGPRGAARRCARRVRREVCACAWPPPVGPPTTDVTVELAVAPAEAAAVEAEEIVEMVKAT